MGLLSFLKRQDEPHREAAPAASPDAVQEARTRARRRLIGATLLLGLGLIGFPVLFETQPRPVAVDVPIEIPTKDGVAPLALPPKRPGNGMPVARALPPVITETAAEAGREVPAPASAAALASAAVAALPKPASDATKPEPTRTEAPKPEAAKPEPAKPEPAKPVADKPAPKPEAKPEAKKPDAKKPEADKGRFVVQVGAFADAKGVREARAKLDKLGLKSFTQEVEVNGATRTRVRVGPFASRDEAVKAADKIKPTGLAGAVLAL